MEKIFLKKWIFKMAGQMNFKDYGIKDNIKTLSSEVA